MVLDPIPQSLPVHFFGSRPQPPTSRQYIRMYMNKRNTSRDVRKNIERERESVCVCVRVYVRVCDAGGAKK